MALKHGRLFLKTDNFIIDSTQIAMVFLYNADNSAPFFDSILFRDEVFWTFSFVLGNCPGAATVLPFIGYVPVGSPAALYPLYSTRAGLGILGSWTTLSAYLQTPLAHDAAYEHGPDLEVPIYVLEPQSHSLNLPLVGQKLSHDGNYYNLYTCVILDNNGTVVHLALHPAGYREIPHGVELPTLDFMPLPMMSDVTFDLTQTSFIPFNSVMNQPDSVAELSVRSPTINRLHYHPTTITSRAHTADSSESGLVGTSSIVGSSILETSYMGSSAYPACGGDTNANTSNNTPGSTGAQCSSTQKNEKLTLQRIMTRNPNWGKALANLRCMLRVVVCCGGCPSLFLLVTAEYASERKALIDSLWPETLTRCNLQQKDLEKITTPDNDVMSDVDILALGDPWFSLWLYDNRRTASTSMMTNRAGFDLKHIFGIALHDKIMSIVTKLMPPQSNCLPLADNGLVWFLRHQITKEMVYHVVFRQNTTPGHRLCLADLDPASFREVAYPPVATLALVVTSCYDVLLDSFNDEMKDIYGFICPSKMHTQICETLPMLFGQSDDPEYAPFMVAMNALCFIKHVYICAMSAAN
ncbi:hypothetical protein BDR03DRAFT_1005319 [Suillus americanus]|nr:hypothetical protein BDR03DRAFT_1005319 [Suillus americanus]